MAPHYSKCISNRWWNESKFPIKEKKEDPDREILLEFSLRPIHLFHKINWKSYLVTEFQRSSEIWIYQYEAEKWLIRWRFQMWMLSLLSKQHVVSVSRVCCFRPPPTVETIKTVVVQDLKKKNKTGKSVDRDGFFSRREHMPYYTRHASRAWLIRACGRHHEVVKRLLWFQLTFLVAALMPNSPLSTSSLRFHEA